MYLKYSLGFLIASLLQAVIVASTEFLNISSLNANFTISQLIIHILAGQIAGYIILFIMRKVESIGKVNSLLLGIIWGIIVWAIIIPINVSLGKINAPWSMGAATLIPSIIAFMLYGIISAYTIKANDLK